jgi:hypothetical protein
MSHQIVLARSLTMPNIASAEAAKIHEIHVRTKLIVMPVPDALESLLHHSRFIR